MYLNVEQCVDHIIELFGDDVRIGMPLGLGKPVPLINALYQRAKQNPKINLTIFTALSLEKPVATSDLQRRLLEPFIDRVFHGVPDLDFMTDMRKDELPANVRIHEVYAKAGAYRNVPKMQQDYMSTNYTHSVRDCETNNNCIYAQIMAKNETENGVVYSSSCNADCFLEAVEAFEKGKERGEKRLVIGVTNSDLPFMYGDSEVRTESFDIIIDDPQADHPLFTTPRQPVSIPDYMIGLHVSTLIKDSGTLQIGIGALGDAIAYGLHLRQNENQAYNNLVKSSGIGDTYGELIEKIGGTEVFEDGLYGSTEMLVDGFYQLYKSGVIKRKVYHHIGVQRLVNQGKIKNEIPRNVLSLMMENEDLHPYLTRKDFEGLQRFGVLREDLAYDDGFIVDGEQRYSALLADTDNLIAISESCLGTQLKNGILLTGGFFIGPRDFYDGLREMPEEERRQFEMTGVDVANQLYGNEVLRSLERKNGRFCNTGMKATLLGAIVSDGLEDGTVISGVGGQYNFVSMGHALPDGRVIMMIKSTRQEVGKTLSNIVYSYGHCTIPRHLRDVVVTEYGIADIRGKCDQDVIKAMLNIADSRFQDELLAEAKKNQKIPEDYEIPAQFRNNTPEKIAATLKDSKAFGLFPDFPNGSAFTDVELLLAFALRVLATKSAGPEAAEFPAMIKDLPAEIPENLKPFVERMGLLDPTTPEDTQTQKTLLLALRLAGFF